MKAELVIEYNDAGTLIYIANYPGAFVRGKTKEEAIAKVKAEIIDYFYWANEVKLDSDFDLDMKIIQTYESKVHVEDADTDILFDCETGSMSDDEYQYLKSLALKSAKNFYELYQSIADKNCTDLKERKTFYGYVPRTAKEIYLHTKDVNAYYFNEIGICADNQGDIYNCRKRGFDLLERQEGYLNNSIHHGSYNEDWTLRKLMRRFIWHDRIHARSMIKMYKRLNVIESINNAYQFKLTV